MNENQVRLRDAGWREQEFARRLVGDKALPMGITLEDFLDHGVYDAHADTVNLTIKGVSRTWKVRTS